MQWTRHQPREQPFVTKSTDGYYGVAADERKFENQFEAFHIDALWATPVSIGATDTLIGAKQICEQHRTTTPSPTI